MSRAGDDVEVPSPKGDGSGGKGTPKDVNPKGSCVEELSSELMQLKLQRKINKLKKKLKTSKNQKLTSSSSSNEETDATFEEEVKGKRGMKGDKKSYNTTSFNYDNLSSSSAFTSVPIGKAPHFDGMDYTKWKYTMKIHLILLNPSVWTVVCTSVDFSEEVEEPGFEQLQQIHHNTQAMSMLLSSL
jgi:hypothetical protein